jgi:hypothetical protein
MNNNNCWNSTSSLALTPPPPPPRSRHNLGTIQKKSSHPPAAVSSSTTSHGPRQKPTRPRGGQASPTRQRPPAPQWTLHQVLPSPFRNIGRLDGGQKTSVWTCPPPPRTVLGSSRTNNAQRFDASRGTGCQRSCVPLLFPARTQEDQTRRPRRAEREIWPWGGRPMTPSQLPSNKRTAARVPCLARGNFSFQRRPACAIC